MMSPKTECLILFAKGLCILVQTYGVWKLARYGLEMFPQLLEEEDDDEGDEKE